MGSTTSIAKQSVFEHGLYNFYSKASWSLCCVLVPDSALSQCLSLSWCIFSVVGTSELNAGVPLWWSNISSRRSRNTPSCSMLLIPNKNIGLMQSWTATSLKYRRYLSQCWTFIPLGSKPWVVSHIPLGYEFSLPALHGFLCYCLFQNNYYGMLQTAIVSSSEILMYRNRLVDELW